MKIGIFTEYFEHDKNSAGRHMSDLVKELSISSESIDIFTLYKHSNKSSFDELNNELVAPIQRWWKKCSRKNSYQP